MRIAILTFHRAYNCGAMLQAWALKTVLERKGHALVDKEFDECLVFGGEVKSTLLHVFQHGALGQLVQTSLAHHLLLARVLPEKEIAHDAHKWHEREHKNPCHGFGRLAVVHQHMQHGSHDDNRVGENDEPVYVNHIFLFCYLTPMSLWVCRDNCHLGWRKMYWMQACRVCLSACGWPVSQG